MSGDLIINASNGNYIEVLKFPKNDLGIVQHHCQ